MVAILVLWGALVLAPLVILGLEALRATAIRTEAVEVQWMLGRSLALAGLIAATAVILGYGPGRLLGTSVPGDGLWVLILMPLVLPRNLFYYAWTLLLSPTSKLGTMLASDPVRAQEVSQVVSILVLALWTWPLAALLMGTGWRRVDRDVWDLARVEAGRRQVFRSVTLPLLAGPVVLAFGVCFVLALSDFATFHLSGIRTIGTELAVLYELTGSTGLVARSAWPLAIVAILVAVALTRYLRPPDRVGGSPMPYRASAADRRVVHGVTMVLLFFSLIVPVLLLVLHVRDTQALRQFLTLHMDDLAWSMMTAAVAATLAYALAAGALFLRTGGRLGSLASDLVCVTLLVGTLIPGSLVAVGLIRFVGSCGLGGTLGQTWVMVALGQAVPLAGIAMLVLLVSRRVERGLLAEMAAVDGASPWAAWWRVHWPLVWRGFVGVFLVGMMLSVTELSATLVLLPAGVPSLAQRLLNQMHYARDQQVIASCLVLIAVFACLTTVVVWVMKAFRGFKVTAGLVLACGLISVAGCRRESGTSPLPDVVLAFGQTGKGPGQFMYPRAIDIGPDGTVFVVDKTGRIQAFSREGLFIRCLDMPRIQAGKPTGISVGPDGNLYVADTHYSRVVVFSPEGPVLREFGRLGKDDGCFIYPTDVAFARDRIYVSEYGGNDRVSVFAGDGRFLFAFGSPGSGRGQFSRPAALCPDADMGILYVADACNHRIAIYDLEGHLQRYIGTVGTGAGQLRYPYGLALCEDHRLAVCEYGNNRVQVFSPEGRSMAVHGGPGRDLGRLAFPWALAMDGTRAYVVDAGNNRIQVWKL